MCQRTAIVQTELSASKQTEARRTITESDGLKFNYNEGKTIFITNQTLPQIVAFVGEKAV